MNSNEIMNAVGFSEVSNDELLMVNGGGNYMEADPSGYIPYVPPPRGGGGGSTSVYSHCPNWQGMM